MLAQIMRTAVVATIIASGASRAPGAEVSPAAPPIRQMLLLRNGEVIEGCISRADDYYVIDLSDGQIRVKQSNVELVCNGLDDGYRRKRAQIQVGNVYHHLKLARWCLRHDLFGRAAVELADAIVADANNPMIGLLRHRLKMAMEPPPSPEAANLPARGPSNEELDRMVRNLPYKAVETFTQSIQPVLMNNCLGSGCHGPLSDVPMRLFRVSRDKSPSRRMTQRNLHSVLQFVDRENPMASRLIKACNGPHGTTQHSVFGERQVNQYRRLLIWTLLLAERPAARSPATVSTPPQSPGKTSAQASIDQSADPFDAEVFNRRYAPAEP